jgi:hypothetical protein
MAHLNDKIAEFFYQELPASEMVDARRHVAECGECRGQLEKFEKTHLALRSSPDLELPHHIVFAPGERRSWWSLFDWRVAVPLSAAVAALIVAVLVALSPTPEPVTVLTSTPAPAVTQAGDYDKIIDEVRLSERQWLSNELAKRDREIQRLQGELEYYVSYQRVVREETLRNASSIQLLAQRTESRN